MANSATLEQLEQQITQLAIPDQLKLLAYISEQLSTTLLVSPTPADEAEIERLLAQCDAAAEQWSGNFDSAEEIRQMRQERDEQIWPSK